MNLSFYEVKITFQAENQEQAEELVEAATDVICGGEGEGDDHVCLRQFTAVGPTPVKV